MIDGFADPPPGRRCVLRDGQRRGRGPRRAGGGRSGRRDGRVLGPGAGGGRAALRWAAGTRSRGPARPAPSPPRPRRTPPCWWWGPPGSGSPRATTGRRWTCPVRQDELVRRVLDANPATVVVVNAASPVTMDWAPDAHALLQTWFGGQEMAGGLADVLLGDAEPAGRLPMTLPAATRAQPVVRQLPGRERPGALRRGRARRLPLVRGPPPADAVPVRARRVVHDASPSASPHCRRDPPRRRRWRRANRWW